MLGTKVFVVSSVSGDQDGSIDSYIEKVFLDEQKAIDDVEAYYEHAVDEGRVKYSYTERIIE